MERVIHVLNEMVSAGVIQTYAIGGAIAALFYMEPIETHDLDVFIVLPSSSGPILSLRGVYGYLEKQGYQPKAEHVLIEGIPVQFLVASSPLVDEAIEKAASKRYGKEKVRVILPEYLVAIMVELNRAKDRIRIGWFLDGVKLQGLKTILKKYRLEKKWAKILKELGRG